MAQDERPQRGAQPDKPGSAAKHALEEQQQEAEQADKPDGAKGEQPGGVEKGPSSSE